MLHLPRGKELWTSTLDPTPITLNPKPYVLRPLRLNLSTLNTPEIPLLPQAMGFQESWEKKDSQFGRQAEDNTGGFMGLKVRVWEK